MDGKAREEMLTASDPGAATPSSAPGKAQAPPHLGIGRVPPVGRRSARPFPRSSSAPPCSPLPAPPGLARWQPGCQTHPVPCCGPAFHSARPAFSSCARRWRRGCQLEQSDSNRTMADDVARQRMAAPKQGRSRTWRVASGRSIAKRWPRFERWSRPALWQD